MDDGRAVSRILDTTPLPPAQGHICLSPMSEQGFHKQFGFQTGDMIKAVVPAGKKKGTHKGKVAVRSSGYFNITTSSNVVQGIKHSYCKLIHRCDGYSYSYSASF